MSKVKISEIENLLKEAAKEFITEDEADYFAKEQIDTHLKKFPRSNPLSDALNDLKSWENNRESKVEIQVNKGSSLLLNFNKLGPSLKLKMIHDELESRAKINGISMVGLNNSGGIHALNLWTDGLGKRDLIGLCFFNGGPGSVVPYGGTTGIFGTNPLSYAIPTNDKPIIVDMATSEIPFFELKNAKQKGILLKKNCAVNAEGQVTTDPKEALTDGGQVRILPMGGGYKGYAMVLLVEILTGSLVRSFLSNEMSPKYVLEEHGGLLIAIDIATFADVGKFKESVSRMCEAIRKQKPATGVEKIIVPGDNSYQKAEQLLRSGEIEIETELLEDLKRISLPS